MHEVWEYALAQTVMASKAMSKLNLEDFIISWIISSFVPEKWEIHELILLSFLFSDRAGAV
jgi:hypothetical protein